MSALPPKADIKIARIALGVVASATWHDPPRPGRMYAGRGLLRGLISTGKETRPPPPRRPRRFGVL